MAEFDKYLHAITMRAQHEAREDASATIEAPHLLLAIAGEPEPAVQQVLAAAGLDKATIRAALKREFEHSLSAAGVSNTFDDLPRPSQAPMTNPTMGSSAKLAIERAVASASHKKDLLPAHLLLGILSAQVGTVPRALALVGVDRDALASGVRQTLTADR